MAALAMIEKIEMAQPDPSALTDLWLEATSSNELTYRERQIALGRIQRYLDDHVRAAQAA